MEIDKPWLLKKELEALLNDSTTCVQDFETKIKEVLCEHVYFESATDEIARDGIKTFLENLDICAEDVLDEYDYEAIKWVKENYKLELKLK